MFFVLSRLWDEGKILSPHEELNLRPSDSALRFSLLFLFTNMTLSTLLILAVCKRIEY